MCLPGAHGVVAGALAHDVGRAEKKNQRYTAGAAGGGGGRNYSGGVAYFMKTLGTAAQPCLPASRAVAWRGVGPQRGKRKRSERKE